MKREPFEARIERWTEWEANSGCRLWFGAVTPKGYGRITLCEGGVMQGTTVHRAVWSDAHGQITSEEFVLHRCDTPACCNLDHLYIGTHADNMADMRRRGRSCRGLKNAHAKLSDEQVEDIRKRFRRGRTRRELAAHFSVSASAICAIIRGDHRPGAERIDYPKRRFKCLGHERIIPATQCVVCGREFTGRGHRSDAKTCSPACLSARLSEASAQTAALRTTCAWGHPFDDANTIWRGNGRQCRTCQNRRNREYLARRAGRSA